MSGDDTSAQMIAALKSCANEGAGAEAPMVSVTMEFLRDASHADIATAVARKTRTLIFVTAEATADGERVATASSVHKVKS
mgnify:CR=1 FL=1